MERQYIKSFAAFLNESYSKPQEEMVQYKERCRNILRKFLDDYKISTTNATQELISSLEDVERDIKNEISNTSAKYDEYGDRDPNLNYDVYEDNGKLRLRFDDSQDTIFTISDIVNYLDSRAVSQNMLRFRIDVIRMGITHNTLEVYFS